MDNSFNKELNDLLKSKDKKQTEDFINNKLSKQQKDQINNILKDKEKLNQILSSDKAKQIMGKFKNK